LFQYQRFFTYSGPLECEINYKCNYNNKYTHTHTHSIPTITDHPTAASLNTMSQLCDGIECRLTARTGGSAKGEILAVQLGKEQTD